MQKFNGSGRKNLKRALGEIRKVDDTSKKDSGFDRDLEMTNDIFKKVTLRKSVIDLQKSAQK